VTFVSLCSSPEKKEKQKTENMKSGRDDLAGGADSAAFWITKKHVDPFPLTEKLHNRSKQWPTPIAMSPAHK
jgi:hypothetical protein